MTGSPFRVVVAARARSLLMEVAHAWRRAADWFCGPFHARLPGAMVERLAVAGPASLLLWTCWIVVRERTALTGVPAWALAALLFISISLLAGSVVLVRLWRRTDAPPSPRKRPPPGIRRVVWVAAWIGFLATPLWLLLQLGGEAHDVWQSVRAADHWWRWLFLPLLMVIPVLKAHEAFVQWRDERESRRELVESRRDLERKATLCRDLLSAAAPMAADGRLTPQALASLIGIDVGDFPEELDAAGDVIQALLKSPPLVTLDITLDSACLERLLEARRQLRAAYVNRSFEPRFPPDQGDPTT